MRNVFGWDLPPGCTDADIDRAFGDPEGEECECCEGTGRVAEPVRRKYWTLWEKVKVFFGGEAPTEDTACPHCDGDVLKETREAEVVFVAAVDHLSSRHVGLANR